MKKRTIVKDTTLNKEYKLTLRLSPQLHFELDNICSAELLSKCNLMRTILLDFIDKYYTYKEQLNGKQG